ncbi:MAG: helix-turn-helix domain-containing protein [Deltaproteobacteria bacterium]|nr:helix-turn-helix domain-containing protein [Deltaproteobacteria bacterium]
MGDATGLPPGGTGLDAEAIEAIAVIMKKLAALASLGRVARAEPEAWMNVSEAARYAAVSEDTLREWIGAGTLRAGKVGRVIRVRPSDIDAALLAGAAAEVPVGGDLREPEARAREILEDIRKRGRDG